MSKDKLMCLLILCATLAGCDEKHPVAAQSNKHVVTEKITLQPVSTTVTMTGRTSETLISEVRPQVTGIIQQRAFKEGQFVKAGQVLYQLDPSTYKAGYDLASAAVKSAEAGLYAVQLKYERLKRLLSSRVVSQQDVDDAYSLFRQDEADVAQKKAALESAAIDLERTTIRSPISGVASVSAVTPGALVTANQADALTRVRKLDPIYVDLQEPSQQWERMKSATGSKDESVQLILNTDEKYPQSGKLELADAAVDPSTATVRLRAVFANPTHALLPGMFVRAVLPSVTYQSAALVPQTAVTFDHKGQASVLTVTSAGKVTTVNVITNGDMKGQWIVTKGLHTGDRVITAGNNRVSPGDSVTIDSQKEKGTS